MFEINEHQITRRRNITQEELVKSTKILKYPKAIQILKKKTPVVKYDDSRRLASDNLIL